MTLTVELSPEKEALVIAQAQSRGLTAQEWLVQIVEQAAQLPKLPVDGADQHDHYIYGTPKRDQ
jgi:hypothetical protein